MRKVRTRPTIRSPVVPAAGVIVVTHNSAAWIRRCLASLRRQDLKASYEVIVVDSGSTDETVELVRRGHDWVKLVRTENRGFGAACNLGARRARGRVLAFVNPDTESDPAWLRELIAPLADGGRIATSQVRLLGDPERLNTEGQTLHFTGLGFVRGYMSKAATEAGPRPVPGFSGAAFALLRADFERLEGFDENIFLYADDTELSWRARRAGFEILGAPASVVYHQYKLRLTAEKLQHLETGRWILLRKHYRWWHLVLYLPSLVLVELMGWAYALRLGFPGLAAKARATRDGLRRPARPFRPRSSTPVSSFASRRIPFRKAGFGWFVSTLGAIPNLVFLLNAFAWHRFRGAR